MIIFKHARELKKYLKSLTISKGPIGFVPTMGALHQGHLSLLKQCKEISAISVCSIFINRAQFNNPDDFKQYPKTIPTDILLLEENGCDILFLPDENEIYPNEGPKKKHFDLGYLETILEGKFRPGHFQGVCLVVEKLLNIVEPDFLLMGQKDFQQCMVIRRLIELMNEKTQLVICPILREESGLAMSSRNLRLSFSERQSASAIYRALDSIKNNAGRNHFPELKKNAMTDMEKNGIKVEYLELADRNTLELIPDFNDGKELIILVAAFVNDVRLIDNLLINS